MDLALDVLAATGYALVVAFTTLPVLSVIAVLLGTRRVSSGLWFAAAYFAGLAVVFGLAALGADQLSWSRWFRPGGLFELLAGLLLMLVAGLWWLWDRSRRSRAGGASTHRFLAWMSTLSPVSCAVVGFQFAFHPENLVLTIAAARHTVDIGWVAIVIVAAWFCLVGVSTVVIPTVIYARGGERARDRLNGLRDWLVSHGTTVTVALLFSVGLVLTVVGAWRLASG